MSRSKKIQEEISRYSEVTHVHDLPPINQYWAEKFLVPKFQALGFTDPNNFYTQYIEKSLAQNPEKTCEMLSIGAGNCDTEIYLATSLMKKGVQNFQFTCMDINPNMLERGKQLAYERKLSDKFSFVETDIKEWRVSKKFQIVIANHSLHHITDLELLFENIYQSLDERGFFLTNDMIGRNGHMRWPEALEILLALWSTLDDKYKLNHATNEYEPIFENFDSSNEGFEGIRAQDILPLLIKRFNFDSFLGFNNLISVFIDRNFGPNFDSDNIHDCHFIDFVSRLDDYFIEIGKIKPTQIIAAMVKHPVEQANVYKHLTPEFCLRPPELKQDYIYITDPNPYAFNVGFVKKIKRRGFHKIIPKSLRLKLNKLVAGRD